MIAHEPPARLSAAEIAAEIARTRSRLSRSLATLDREYALRHVFVRSLRMVHDGKLDVGSLAQGVQKNIVPVALIAAGLAWVALAGRGGASALVDRLADGIALLKGLAQQFGGQAHAAGAADASSQSMPPGAAIPTALPDK